MILDAHFAFFAHTTIMILSLSPIKFSRFFHAMRKLYGFETITPSARFFIWSTPMLSCEPFIADSITYQIFAVRCFISISRAAIFLAGGLTKKESGTSKVLATQAGCILSSFGRQLEAIFAVASSLKANLYHILSLV